MASLETVKLLESKVTQTIEYVKKVTGENLQLKEKLSSYQKRITDLEVLLQQFKENQSRIEDGILSALDRLNQFEDALESKLSADPVKPAGSGGVTENKSPTESKAPTESKVPTESKPEKKSPGPIIAPETPSKPPLPIEEEKDSDPEHVELDIF